MLSMATRELEGQVSTSVELKLTPMGAIALLFALNVVVQ